MFGSLFGAVTPSYETAGAAASSPLGGVSRFLSDLFSGGAQRPSYEVDPRLAQPGFLRVAQPRYDFPQPTFVPLLDDNSNDDNE